MSYTMASGNLKKRKSQSSMMKYMESKKRKQRSDACQTPKRKKSPWLSVTQDTKGCSVFNRLIDTGTISDHETVFYLRKRDNSIMKEGKMTREGVLCCCCGELFLLSKFEVHAGSTLHRPSANMFLRDGRSIMQCLQSIENSDAQCDKISRRSMDVNRSTDSRSMDSLSPPESCISDAEDTDDGSDNVCQICGDGGRLMLCDSCPSAFHAECLYLDGIPEGEWHCPGCRCCRCGRSGKSIDGPRRCSSNISALASSSMVSCAQCHASCHRECVNMGPYLEYEGNWFCKRQCRDVFVGLRELLGRPKPLDRGLSWMLLRSYKQDVMPSIRHITALTYERTLSEALKVLQECFDPVLDCDTKIDLLTQAVFNRKSDVLRLDCSGFYAFLLMKGDDIVSVATVRIHGEKVAEMPFIATRNEYRNQGMCKSLMGALEKMLHSVGVYKLVLPSISELVGTWTNSFSFKPMPLQDRKDIADFILMSFPGTSLLQKSLFLAEKPYPDSTTVSSETRVSRVRTGLFKFKVKLLPPGRGSSTIQPITCH